MKIGITMVGNSPCGRYTMMRSVKLACVAAAVVCLIGCAHTSNPLVGSWRLVSSDGQAVEAKSADRAPVKILNDTHFAFGFMTAQGTVYGGGGRYELSGDTFTEIATYHSYPDLIGRRLAFRCELEGDRWHHSGSFTVGANSFSVDEVWERIKPETAREKADRLARARHRR
jgi:hypothetical protein